MSISDAQRFADDIAKDPELRDAVKGAATGLASIVEFAKSKGYEFSIDEAKEYILSKSPKDLTDEQLDAIAGGKHHHSSVATSSTVAQTTAVASTAVEAAEVATSAVQVAEAAADVAAAVEVVAVAAAVLT
ncbi:Nif11-like leader peptide family natural product precursor [Roseibium suaedae]|uniref:Nif11-like leader peptide domain-containing protein n=1 Tax=Roseibium suaedae TaxID=735517 RepID=A0A1M7HWR0_9HYPH|nr:Nif11-like leader peptide family natural product precursor [Roseibium suaedae]SHM32900.1 nif11-like leader peptide domain-containing protein [Roseibium suaedae]